MKVRLLLFATYRDFAGAGELTLELPYGANARDAVAQLRVRAPRIPERPVVAINQEYSSLDEVLRDGDELALLPPVAGG
jgi:MoaE-MoaD fusion protein